MQKKIPAEIYLIPIMAVLHWFWYLQGTFWRSPHACWLGDGFILHTLAQNLLEHGQLLYAESTPTLTQLPAYPALIATIYALGEGDTRWVLQFQMLFACLSTPLFVYLLRPWLGNWRWLWAGFWIVDLHQLLYTGCLTTEFWVCQCWMFAWLLGSRSMLNQNLHLFLGSTFLLCLAAWFKPLSLYVPIFFFASLFLSAQILIKKDLALRNNKLLGRTIAWIAIGASLYLLSLSPLLIRNHQLTGQWRYTTISSFNLWYFNIPYYLALKGEIDLHSARAQQVDVMRLDLNAKGTQLPPIPANIANDRHAHRKALGIGEYQYAKLADELSAPFFKQHFWGYLWQHLSHSLNIFTVSNLSWLKLVHQSFEPHSFSWSPANWWDILLKGDTKSWLLCCRLLEICSVIFFCSMACIGLSFTFFRRTIDPTTICGISFILYVPLLCGVNVWGRFRYLFMPMLIALAVVGCRESVRVVARWRRCPKLRP
jgi:hypothetical protein